MIDIFHIEAWLYSEVDLCLPNSKVSAFIKEATPLSFQEYLMTFLCKKQIFMHQAVVELVYST